MLDSDQLKYMIRFIHLIQLIVELSLDDLHNI
jgi:hypothetical protein